MARTMVLPEKVDYCPVVHGGCGERLAWIPHRDGSKTLEATCGSCGHHWELPPGVGLDR